MNFRDFKHTFGHGSGFIHGDQASPGQGFKEIGAFDQNPGAAGTADPGKKGQRDGDYQRTGA